MDAFSAQTVHLGVKRELYNHINVEDKCWPWKLFHLLQMRTQLIFHRPTDTNEGVMTTSGRRSRDQGYAWLASTWIHLLWLWLLLTCFLCCSLLCCQVFGKWPIKMWELVEADFFISTINSRVKKRSWIYCRSWQMYLHGVTESWGILFHIPRSLVLHMVSARLDYISLFYSSFKRWMVSKYIPEFIIMNSGH